MYSHKPAILRRRILTSHVVLYSVKGSLHKSSLIKLFTAAHWTMDAGERGIATLAFQKQGNGANVLFVTVSQVNSWFVKIVLKQIIAAIRPLRKFRMVFYNFCYYFSGKHWRWTEISILGNEFFGFHKFPLHPTLSLPPCPTAASVSLHWLHQGFPTFPFQCTPSAFQHTSMYPFSISTDKHVPLHFFNR